jgi:hypothetical protein
VVAGQAETVAMVLLASHKEVVHPRTLWSSTCTRQSSSPWSVSAAAVLQAASMLKLLHNFALCSWVDEQRHVAAHSMAFSAAGLQLVQNCMGAAALSTAGVIPS